MNFESQEKVIEYINSLVSSNINKILYNLPLEKDIEIVIIDENKSFGYVVLYLPVEKENINLGYIPFTTDYSYCKFLFLQIQDEIYPVDSKYIERLIPPQIKELLVKSSEYKNYKETSHDIVYSKYSDQRLKKIKEIIKNLKNSEKKIIPKTIKEKIRSRSERESMPSHYFLMPKERKFPVKDPSTGKYHCGLLRAAITRAAQHKYKNVENKARKLYEKHCKDKKTSSDILLELGYTNDENIIANYLYKHSEYIDENTLSYIMPYLINPYNLPQNNINLSPILIYHTLNKTSNLLDYENNIKTSGAGTVLAVLAGLGIMGALGFAGYKYLKHHEDYNNKHLKLYGKEASFIDKLQGSLFYGGDLLKHKFGISEKELEIGLNNKLGNMADSSKNIWGGIGKHVGFKIKEGELYDALSQIGDDRRLLEGMKNKDYGKIAQAIKETPNAHQNLINIYEIDAGKLMEELTKENAKGLKEHFDTLKSKIEKTDISDEEKQYYYKEMDEIIDHFKDPKNVNKANNFIFNRKVKITEDVDPNLFVYNVSRLYRNMSMASDILKDKNVVSKVKNSLPSETLKLDFNLGVKDMNAAKQLDNLLEKGGYYDRHKEKLKEQQKEVEEKKPKKEPVKKKTKKRKNQ